ncbi:hypothetical protein ACHWQZ_G000199 [Mnemiopsis leidyi]
MSNLILGASWITVVLSSSSGDFKACESTIRNIEGDLESYFCDVRKECCPTEEEPNKCCLPDMDRGIIPITEPVDCTDNYCPDQGIKIAFLNVTVSLKMLLLYILLGVLIIVVLVLCFCGCYRVIRRRRRDNLQDKVELEQAVDSLDRFRGHDRKHTSRRFDNYGDEILEPPPYDQKPPPEYQYHGPRTTLPSAPPPHEM